MHTCVGTCAALHRFQQTWTYIRLSISPSNFILVVNAPNRSHLTVDGTVGRHSSASF